VPIGDPLTPDCQAGRCGQDSRLFYSCLMSGDPSPYRCGLPNDWDGVSSLDNRDTCMRNRDGFSGCQAMVVGIFPSVTVGVRWQLSADLWSPKRASTCLNAVLNREKAPECYDSLP
jgi:hypothetical protein